MRTIESAREEFVKKLKTDLSQNLDFDFTRPEMCAAFVIKYFDETRMFITKDKDLQLAIATPEGQNPNAQLTFRLTTENGKDIMELLHKHPNPYCQSVLIAQTDIFFPTYLSLHFFNLIGSTFCIVDISF